MDNPHLTPLLEPFVRLEELVRQKAVMRLK